MIRFIGFIITLILFAVVDVPPAYSVTFEPANTHQAKVYQKWADESKAPTYPGIVTVAPSILCDGLYGCSEQNSDGSFDIYAADRDSLYYELGHIFDWAMLRGYMRRYMSIRWDSKGSHWESSAVAIAAGEAEGVGVEDGLEGMFAMVYNDCAWGNKTTDTSYAESVPDDLHLKTPSIYTGTFDTCKYIRAKRNWK